MYNINTGSRTSDTNGEDTFRTMELPPNFQVWHTPVYCNNTHDSANHQYPSLVQPYQHANSHRYNRVNPANEAFLSIEPSWQGQLNMAGPTRMFFHATQCSIVPLNYPNPTNNIFYRPHPFIINPHAFSSYTFGQTGNNPPPTTTRDLPFDGSQVVTQGGMPIGTVPHRQDQIRHYPFNYVAPRQVRFTEMQAVPIMGQVGEPPAKRQAILMDSRLQARPPARVMRCLPPVSSALSVSLASVPSQHVNPQSSPPKVRRKLERLLPPAVADIPHQPTPEVQTLDLMTMEEVIERRENSPTKKCCMIYTNEVEMKTECNESFDDPHLASKHIQEEHGFRSIKDGKGEEEACAWFGCTESFKNVHRHIMEVHFKVKYFCPDVRCTYRHTRLDVLKTHINVKHADGQNQRNQSRLKGEHSSISKGYPNGSLAIFEEDA